MRWVARSLSLYLSLSLSFSVSLNIKKQNKNWDNFLKFESLALKIDPLFLFKSMAVILSYNSRPLHTLTKNSISSKSLNALWNKFHFFSCLWLSIKRKSSVLLFEHGLSHDWKWSTIKEEKKLWHLEMHLRHQTVVLRLSLITTQYSRRKVARFTCFGFIFSWHGRQII